MTTEKQIELIKKIKAEELIPMDCEVDYEFVNEQHQKLSAVYWEITQEMQEEFGEDEVWIKVIENYFMPCGNCGQPFYMGTNGHCPYCGDLVWD